MSTLSVNAQGPFWNNVALIHVHINTYTLKRKQWTEYGSGYETIKSYFLFM